MKTRKYIEQVVNPMFARLCAEPDSIDLQVATSIIVFHACDYIANDKGENSSDVVKRIKSQNTDFELIHAAANANKHHTITKSPKRYRNLSNPQNPKSTEGLTWHGDDITWHGDRMVWTTEAHYLSNDGRKVPIIKLIQECIDIIEKET